MHSPRARLPGETTARRAGAVPRDPRWAKVLARDRRADGSFFYGVRTTGIYCRPSCAARRPRAENVVFFASADEAERAGFRACRRCRPRADTASARNTALITALCRAIEQATTAPTLAMLAAQARMSPFHLQRLFKSVTGVTPKAYAAAIRARRLRDSLAQDATITDTLYATGFNSSGRFYAQTDRLLGMTPTQFRAGGASTTIHYGIGANSLGEVLVAATERGVCAILLGDDGRALLTDLRQRFPAARIVAGDSAYAATVARAVAFVDDPRTGLSLPLDIRGTAFQQRVWQALCAIPAGTTATYAEIARRIGAPKSVRAVAGACAANALAVAVPCHRVVRGDGGLAGYRWGIARKKALLARERPAREGPPPA